MNDGHPQFALVTGASSGIGFELARCCITEGFDVVAVADDPLIHTAANELQSAEASVIGVEADLSTPEGVARAIDACQGRPVDALLANAGLGLGGSFLDQSFARIKHVIDTNITGTVDLVQRVAREMRERGRGRILITGSIAGLMPGTYQAVYNGTKAFLDNFSYALRADLRDTGVTVTCLMPGATETDFFERAEMTDNKLGTQKKSLADEVARAGFAAMMKGEGEVITGWNNKLRAAISHILLSMTLAEMHRKEAALGSGAHGR
jgi:uncharacterized protein